MELNFLLTQLEQIAQASHVGASLNIDDKRGDMNARSLDTYCNCFGIDLPAYVLWKRKQLERPVVVMDFCCGYGQALGELENKVGDVVYVIGVDILHYQNHEFKKGSFVVADLKNIPHSVIPQLPASCVDIGMSLFGVPFRFNAHVKKYMEEGVKQNIAFFGEVERLLVSGGESYFHSLEYPLDSFERIQQCTQSFLQRRTIAMSEGTISHVYMRKP